MTHQHPSTRTKGKQFRLVKYFSWASFIVLLLFSFPFSLYISQQAKNILITSYENYALLVGQNLNHQVFQNFAIPVLRRYGEIRLRDKVQYNWMDRVVKNTIHGFNVDLVNIYSIGQGVIAYSTDSSLIGLKVKETPGYKKAVQGELSSRSIFKRKSFLGLDIQFLGGEEKLRTYIPFRGKNPFTGTQTFVAGVFEVIQDMSDPYRSIVRFQFIVFGLSILIMGSIFLAQLLIVHKAETLIAERAREQMELEVQLHQAERLAALGEMIAGVSHEIKNPLGIIQSTAELLGGQPDADETQKRLSEVIREESVRLNNIVTEFLDFAKPETPNFQECQLKEIIEKNLTFLSPEMEKKGIQVETQVLSRSTRTKADPDFLHRAFLNILINGMQSMEHGGSLTVRIEDDRDFHLVSIKDTGPGISEEILSKVFNPFFTTKDRGTGLGLAIVKKIIEGHEGRIDMESREGEGTTVRIRLPRRA